MTGDVAALYSKALFELALEQSALEPVNEELRQFKEIFQQNPELIKLLASPAITLAEKLDVISKIFGTDSVVCDFLCVVTEKNRISYILKIAEAFNSLYNDYNNIAEITVTTSIPLSDPLRQKLSAKLSQRFGKTVKLIEKIDPSILGGVVIDYGNTQIDGSIKKRIENIASAAKI